MSRLDIILAAMLLAALATLAGTAALLRGKADECARLAANQSALMDTLGAYRTSDGLRAVQVRRLTMTSDELRAANARLLERINSLGVRRRDVEAVQSVATAYTASFAPDTVFIRDTAALPAPRLSLAYEDRWLRFRFDTIAHVRLTDTVTIVHHARTRRFLWFTWRRYTGRATAVSSCPYASIASVDAIDITN